MKEFQYLKAHTARATKATCAGPLTFGSRIHPGKQYKGVVDVAERFAEVINAELKALVRGRGPDSARRARARERERRGNGALKGSPSPPR